MRLTAQRTLTFLGGLALVTVVQPSLTDRLAHAINPRTQPNPHGCDLHDLVVPKLERPHARQPFDPIRDIQSNVRRLEARRLECRWRLFRVRGDPVPRGSRMAAGETPQ